MSLAGLRVVGGGIDVVPDPYLPTWIAVGDEGERSRAVYALKKNGIARRIYCSPENFKLLLAEGGKVSVDVLSWAVVEVPEMEFRL